ncbi:MAG: hypothetical protein ACRDVE_05580 [Actinocrinis sp.]
MTGGADEVRGGVGTVDGEPVGPAGALDGVPGDPMPTWVPLGVGDGVAEGELEPDGVWLGVAEGELESDGLWLGDAEGEQSGDEVGEGDDEVGAGVVAVVERDPLDGLEPEAPVPAADASVESEGVVAGEVEAPQVGGSGGLVAAKPGLAGIVNRAPNATVPVATAPATEAAERPLRTCLGTVKTPSCCGSSVLLRSSARRGRTVPP